MKNYLSILIFLVLTTNSAYASNSWHFNQKTGTAEVKIDTAILMVGCESFNPSNTVMTLQIAGPNGIGSNEVENVEIVTDNHKELINMDFQSNADGWKWADTYPDWKTGIYSHLEKTQKLKMTIMGQPHNFPTTDLSKSLQALKKFCN